MDIDDDISKASSLMEDLNVSQLPVLEKGQFRGFIADEMLFDDLFNKSSLSSFQLTGANCTIYGDQHFYEAAGVANGCEHGMIAVSNRDDMFEGVITADGFFKAFSQTIGVQAPGSLVVLSIKQIDYSLAEISRLVEAENVKILGCFLNSDPADPVRLEVTLKLDKKNVSAIVATLERFSYQVTGLYQQEHTIPYEKERLDALMKYLSI